MKEYWNARHERDMISTNDSKEIWSELKEKMSNSCDRESCWLRSKFMEGNVDKELLNYTFAPKSPEYWKRKPNEWLSSLDIEAVMKQYEKFYKCFEFLGPSPIDYDVKKLYGEAFTVDLCFLYDPEKNDNERSPLTEVYNELIATGKKEDKDLASQYRSRLFYIVKVINRDNEQDGVKFWRFKHNYKQEGVLDKILPIWKAKGDLTDSEKGRDLIIELIKAKTPQGKEYTVVQTIMYDDPAPIHTDSEIMEGWMLDELTWKDVYAKKPVEYLEAVAVGETPMWSSELKKYVYGDETEISLGGGTETKVETPIVDPQANNDVDEDLPF
jgi:hypothetical protein